MVNNKEYQNALTSNSVNVSLQSQINPESISNEPVSSCKITFGSDYIVYENTNLSIFPALQPILANDQEVTIEIPSIMRISEEV